MVNNGYEVKVLAWNRRGDVPNSESINGYSIERFALRAPHGKKIILYWPIWWSWVFIKLLLSNFDCVHAADFDTYLPSLCASKIKQKPIIYDIYDFYPDIVKLPSLIHSIFRRLDISLMNHANEVIIVDKCRINQVGKGSISDVTIIYNSPSDYLCKHSYMPTSTDTLKIFYGGNLFPDRDVISMIYVADSIDSISLTLAGWGNRDIVEEIKHLADNREYVDFLGLIPYSEVLFQSINSDILYALYDPAVPNNRLASPNKLFEAMMCGKPIIVNEGVATADKVREENCGLVVPYGDYEALKEAVLTLKNNPELRKELGENGRRAYETKYNWKIMEKRLLDLYASLEKEQ